MAAPNQLQIHVIPKENAISSNLHKMEEEIDYSGRAQWLRAAVLGANDGLVSIASLMMGVGALKHDVRAMILTAFAGLFTGACSMAIGEFVSVYSPAGHRESPDEEREMNGRKWRERRRLDGHGYHIWSH